MSVKALSKRETDVSLTLLLLLCSLALTAFLLARRNGRLVVVALRLGSLALLGRSGLARSGGRSGGTDLSTSVFDLLEDVVGRDPHAVDRCTVVVGSGFLPVDLSRLAFDRSVIRHWDRLTLPSARRLR